MPCLCAFGCQATALIVGQSKAPTAELLLQDAGLLEEVVDLPLAVLAHPASEGGKDEPEEHEGAQRDVCCPRSGLRKLLLHSCVDFVVCAQSENCERQGGR